MQRFGRLSAAGPRVLAILATVVTLAAGAAITAPMADAGLPGACNWQPLPLLNGWQSEQSAYNTGDPTWCVDNGVTYLAGSLDQPAAGSEEFAQLPPVAAPASTLYLSVYTYSGPGGVLRIFPNGAMEAYQGRATEFTSLAGVSFPAAQSAPASTPLVLENGWHSEQSQYGTGDPAYFVSGGIVHLSGSIANTDTNWADGFFTGQIPQAIVPDYCTEANVYAYGGAEGAFSSWGNADFPLGPGVGNGLYVQDTGQNVGQVPSDAAQFTSLASLAYPAAGPAWQPLTLINGWYNGEDNCFNGAPSYVVKAGIVYLNGLLDQQPNGGSCGFAVLPAAARPTHTLYFTVNAEGLGNADVRISPDGTTCAWSSGYDNGVAVGMVASLGGISYQRGA